MLKIIIELCMGGLAGYGLWIVLKKIFMPTITPGMNEEEIQQVIETIDRFGTNRTTMPSETNGVVLTQEGMTRAMNALGVMPTISINPDDIVLDPRSRQARMEQSHYIRTLHGNPISSPVAGAIIHDEFGDGALRGFTGPVGCHGSSTEEYTPTSWGSAPLSAVKEINKDNIPKKAAEIAEELIKNKLIKIKSPDQLLKIGEIIIKILEK